MYSRYRFVYPAFRETTTDVVKACEAAWRFYGGILKALIVDNPRAIVQDPDALHPQINPAFLEHAQARGFMVDTTRVRKPRDKARVERAVRCVRDDCFGGEVFSMIEEARNGDDARNVHREEASFPKRLVLPGLLATHLLEDGTNIRIIQSLLGHRSLATTQVYTHVARTYVNDTKSPLDRMGEGTTPGVGRGPLGRPCHPADWPRGRRHPA